MAVDNELFKETDSSSSRLQKESLEKGNSCFSTVLMSLIIQDIPDRNTLCKEKNCASKDHGQYVFKAVPNVINCIDYLFHAIHMH